MRNLHFIPLLLLFMITACDSTEKDPDQPTQVVNREAYVEPLWKIPLHAGAKTSNSIIESNIAFDQKIVLATTNGPDNRRITCVNVENGEVLWHWADLFNAPIERMDIMEPYIHNGVLAYHRQSKNYAIDLETGTTNWKVWRNGSVETRISGHENTIFYLANPVDTLQGINTYSCFKADLLTGEATQFLLPKVILDTWPGSGYMTSFGKPKPVTYLGRNYLVLIVSDPYPNWHSIVSFSLYDLDENKWVYDRKVVMEESRQAIGNVDIEFYEAEGLVYVAAGSQVNCHHLLTGDLVWTNDFPGDLMFSGYIIEEGVFVANCGDGVLYGLDARTGQPRWLGEGAGTSSRLQNRYLNGVVYFSGGSTDRIHAVDIQTGKTLWRLDPGRYEGANEDDWKPDLYVVPGVNGEKGRVVACTFLHAYCFEAVR